MTPHPKPKTRRRKTKRGRPPGTTKAPRLTAQARILESTAAWLLQQHPGARSLHHAAALTLDYLARQGQAHAP